MPRRLTDKGLRIKVNNISREIAESLYESEKCKGCKPKKKYWK